MLSSALLLTARQSLTLPSAMYSDEKDEVEQPTLKLSVNKHGQLVEVNQIDDYLYRGEELQHMCFYDFVRCVHKVSGSKSGARDVKGTAGALPRCSLLAPHPESQTHYLVIKTDPNAEFPPNALVPRVIGCSIPRAHADSYPLFMLSHFKPWSISKPLLNGLSPQEAFEQFDFLPQHSRIMQNWEDLYECQDERDAEQLRKQETAAKASSALTKSLFNSVSDQWIETAEDFPSQRVSMRQEAQAFFTLQQLHYANWFLPPFKSASSGGTFDPSHTNNVLITPHILKLWSQSIKRQDKALKQARRAAVEVEDVGDVDPIVPSTEQFSNVQFNNDSSAPYTKNPPHTQTKSNLPPPETEDEIINRVAKQHKLNEMQTAAFKIAACHFLEVVHALRSLDQSSQKPKSEPLRMFMTGPGGTGKTHVVKALQSLMQIYGFTNAIRYLAPTGTAASLVDGTTIHAGLGIKISPTNQGKGGRNPGEDNEDWTCVIDVRKASEIRLDWLPVLFVLIDEVSMVSLKLLCELDHALRYAKEAHGEWFGGINIIFSGDFYQYSPVGGSPLYTPVTKRMTQSDDEIKNRLGRIAWKTVNTVIILEEQMRMAADKDFGLAVLNLRTRTCTIDDVVLFRGK